MREVLVSGDGEEEEEEGGRGADAGIPRGVATVLHSLWTTRTRPTRRPDRERLGPLTKIRRNSKLFAHPIPIYPARNERGCASRRESTKRIYIYVCIRVYVYDAHNKELSIIHGSHDR